VRAAEFVEVCLGLWDSWEDDAFQRDVESGRYFDPAKMHRLEHSGEYFKVRGPLNIPRSPQGRPLLVQAGASAAGVDFAARFADMVFVTPQNLEDAQEKYRTIKEAAAAYGRDPEQIKIMPGLAVLPGKTREDADRRYAELQSLLADEVALNNLSMKLKTDVSGYPRDEPLPESVRDDANPVIFDQWKKIGAEEDLNLRELAVRASTSLAGHFVAGSGVEIADLMQEWFENEAADGFNIQPLYEPGAFTAFTDWVQPELRSRGLLGAGYEGTTLRDHFGLPRPEWGAGWPDAKQ
jgi:FMN-dependent oxidoreductase (nitrilotriacetate monooxygenase family)